MSTAPSAMQTCAQPQSRVREWHAESGAMNSPVVRPNALPAVLTMVACLRQVRLVHHHRRRRRHHRLQGHRPHRRSQVHTRHHPRSRCRKYHHLSHRLQRRHRRQRLGAWLLVAQTRTGCAPIRSAACLKATCAFSGVVRHSCSVVLSKPAPAAGIRTSGCAQARKGMMMRLMSSRRRPREA